MIFVVFSVFSFTFSAAAEESGKEVCIKTLDNEVQCGIIVVSEIPKPDPKNVYSWFFDAQNSNGNTTPFEVFTSNYVKDQCAGLSSSQCDRIVAYAWERYVLGSGW